ncbi:MAG: bifunctional hydroxymethylpyrimidine kinase/phosphomethylpyrimidine kinase [Cyclobacteriaceae bacterium]|nr:bifunctional hydroxymethylpyrimidine kinase/phosphomethylpyrimidine kinase [Cyclobacteriaceae bacterium]MCH8517598.1 bifunctional hydroxymethylpyrimidine kinase/phosphomethylpyrimidine kinase [Cyclobacteriaceae bacterium]
MSKQYLSVLSIAGSDSGGGAGIQADLKTFSALGCYGCTAITAVTVQNTLGVSGIHAIPSAVVSQQIRSVMDDIRPVAVKIGMIFSNELVDAVADTLLNYRDQIKIVFDPVMVAASGDPLILEETRSYIINKLFPIADLITPNLDEAKYLLQINHINDQVEMKAAAQSLIDLGSQAVLLKGGHLDSDDLYDLYLSSAGDEEFYHTKRINTTNIHGSGCSLSSAIAAFLARGEEMSSAIKLSHQYINDAIKEAADVQIGAGSGPLNHFFAPEALIKVPIK